MKLYNHPKARPPIAPSAQPQRKPMMLPDGMTYFMPVDGDRQVEAGVRLRSLIIIPVNPFFRGHQHLRIDSIT
jgi:hypothetical protein